MTEQKEKLTGLTEIYRYLRRNKTPIYVVMPTPFNLLGLDQWVGGLEFVNYFDVFDGQHPRVFKPTQLGAPVFQSMEDVGNYLIDHPDVQIDSEELQVALQFPQHKDVALSAYSIGESAAALGLKRPWTEGQKGYLMSVETATMLAQARAGTA